MADRPLPTPELCRQLLRYEPETGLLYWRERPRHLCADDRIHRSWNTQWADKQAFNVERASGLSGYVCYVGSIYNQRHMAHRVAWAVYYGEWPTDEIDHINGNPLDNRIVNLRSVSHRTNRMNTRRPSNNKSGYLGVYWATRHGKWLAKIKMPDTRRYKHLGLYANIEDAAKAVEAAKAKYGYHPNHGRAA